MTTIKRAFASFSLCFLIGTCAVLLVQAGVYAHVLLAAPTLPETADAIVVFMGSPTRVKKAYELYQAGAGKRLILSPATKKQVHAYEKVYHRGMKAAYVEEESARSTFENALLVSRILREQKIRSVILVTSSYHMPRSFILLKLFSAGSGMAIRRCPIHPEHIQKVSGNIHLEKSKLLHNEFVELWGSLVEFGLYVKNGDLPSEKLRKSATVSWLRRLILFEVDPYLLL